MKSSTTDLEKRLYPALRKKQLELALLPPQTLGPFTPLYHRIMPYIKVAPWRIIFISTIVATFFLRLLLGHSFVFLASLLQRGY